MQLFVDVIIIVTLKISIQRRSIYRVKQIPQNTIWKLSLILSY